MILRKPIVTEKMTDLSENGKYVFEVDKTANKIQIKKAVEDMYGVNVKSVNTMVYYGKKKTRFTKTGVVTGRKSVIKKAIVQVADGEMIDFYSNI